MKKILLILGLLLSFAFLYAQESASVAQLTLKKQQTELRTVSSDVDRCDKITHVSSTQSREIWALESFFDAPAGAHVAVGTDGNHFYTATWNAAVSSFCRYNMDGSNPQTFTITGVAVIRSLTYDGTYFYGGHGGNSTIYKLDLANQTLVGTITSGAGNTRHLAYDPTLNSGAGGFWTGDWTTLAAISMTGTVLIPNTSTATVASVYGSAYDRINHCLWLNTQNAGGASIQKYDIASNTLTESVYDLNSEFIDHGIGGGACIFETESFLWLAANVQITPNKILIYQLALTDNIVPAAPANFEITPAYSTESSRVLSWTNPTTTYGGTALTSISKVVIKRNGVTVHEITSGVTPGGNMTWTDNLPTLQSYNYSIYAVSTAGEGDRAKYRVHFGCFIRFALVDAYGDGWNGASISVSIDGQNLAPVTLESGASGGCKRYFTESGDLKLTWNAGQYDDECSFKLFNGNGDELYTSPIGMTPGVCYNEPYACGEGGDPCPAVSNVTATAQGKKVTVNWSAATGDVANYKIYQDNVEKATVPAGTTTWTSGDLANGTYTFAVAATYANDCVPVKVNAAPVTVQSCDGVVSNLEVAYAEDCGKATITWDAPSKNRGNTARGYRAYPSASAGYIEFDVDNIIGHTVITTAWHAFGGGYFEGKLYNYECESNGTGPSFFQIIDSETGVLITSVPRPELYASVVGSVCYDYTTETMYAMRGGTPNILCTVNLATGELTQVITISGTTNSILAMVIDLDGNMYGMEASPSAPDAKFYSINKTTGATTLIGNTGQYMNYAQSMAFDYNDPDMPLYWAQLAQPTTLIANWFKVDVATGAVTSIQANTNMEITSLHFPYDPNGPVETKYNVYRDGEKIAGPITETTFEDITFDKTKPYTWSVAVICPSGGDGALVEVEKDACDAPPPPPCDIVTGATAAITDCVTATITWTAVEGAVGYKVNDETVETNEYTETGDFEHGKTYTWTIITVCELNESDPVEVSAVGECEGINELSHKFAVRPNPATHDITITAANSFNTIEVLNFLGQAVMSQPNEGNSANVDVSNLPNGIYFVRITSETGASVKKFVKQ